MSYVNFGRKNTFAEAKTSANHDKIYFPTDEENNVLVLDGKEYGTSRKTIKEITDRIDEISEVTASALNRLNTSAGFDDEGMYIPAPTASITKDATSIGEAIALLENYIVTHIS